MARYETGAEHSDDPSLARVGAFSDAVYAFAITLLILAIRIPHPTDTDASRGLLTLLTDQWRNYLAFVLTFMMIGMNWTNHRVMFKTFVRADHTLIWLNLVYLMLGVAFMPVPTAVLGAWLGSSHDNQVIATVFYGAAATVGGLAFNVLWWYGAYAARLTSPELTASQRRAHTIAWGPAPFVAAGLTGVAFASPLLAVAGFIGLQVVYILPVPRLVLLKQQRHRR
jgi:TMEM175 potassium channel family protein